MYVARTAISWEPGMSITVREYADADWHEIARIHDAARLDELRPTVGLDAFLDLEATYDGEGLFDGEVWMAEMDGRVTRFIAAANDEITWTYVDPAHYRQGVARAVLHHVLARATAPIELEVLDGNDTARAAYESVGFVVTETTTGKLAGNESFVATGHTMRWEPAARESTARMLIGGKADLWSSDSWDVDPADLEVTDNEGR